MKRVAVGIVCSFSVVVFAIPGIPDGTYLGKGRLKTAAGFEHDYAAKLVLSGNEMTASYDYGTGKEVVYVATIQPTSSLEFQVLEAGKGIGSGYCYNGGCHLDLPGHKAEETWFLDGGSISRVGSMDHRNGKLVYAEKLAAPSSRSEKLVLECEGFEHSATVKVRIYRADDKTGSLVEVETDGKEHKRALTKEEITGEAYRISPIHGIERTIRKGASGWVVSYGCGEDRPLACR